MEYEQWNMNTFFSLYSQKVHQTDNKATNNRENNRQLGKTKQ